MWERIKSTVRFKDMKIRNKPFLAPNWHQVQCDHCSFCMPKSRLNIKRTPVYHNPLHPPQWFWLSTCPWRFFPILERWGALIVCVQHTRELMTNTSPRSTAVYNYCTISNSSSVTRHKPSWRKMQKDVMKMLKKCPKIGKKSAMVYTYMPTTGST